jgi:DNA polymerase (family 10)
MQNHEIAKVLSEVADMLEVCEENFFRVRAYRNAARTIRDYPVQLSDLGLERLREVPGIGSDLADKLAALLATGEMQVHRELREKVSSGLVELLKIPGLGPKRVRLLSERLNIKSLDDLKRAAEAGALSQVRGFGKKMQESILEGLARHQEAPSRRVKYADAARVLETVLAHLRSAPALDRLEAAGSFRRRRDTIGDLDLLAITSQPAAVIEHLQKFSAVRQVLGRGETKLSVVLNDGLQVDLRVLPRQSYGAGLIYFTGSQAHCVHLRRIAQDRDMLLNEYGLYRDAASIAGAEEDEVYAALGLPWIPPELREDRGEIEAAIKGALPPLLQRTDLKGDLHSHSTYTDGRASIEEMVRAAKNAGLEYLAVTDHSKRLTMAHGLDPVRLREQWKEIEQVEATVGGIKLLRGIEVDILENGELDLPNDVLEELDWVVASVHYKLAQDSETMTRRLITAIKNPNVDVIGHPSGRLIDRRQPTEFDLGEIIRVAREEGCALEVNSQPERLDLTDTACLMAKRAGVKMVVSSDSHHPREFGYLEHGVAQARRGWLSTDDVLNTRPVNELRQRR